MESGGTGRGAQKYGDIINRHHHVSTRHTPMSLTDRAAQFAPFAALTGYDATIQEAGRLTDTFGELAEDEEARLDEKLRRIAADIDSRPEVTVIWFRPDDRKNGGTYVSTTGRVKKIDPNEQCLVLTDGTQILFSRIVSVSGKEDKEDV